MVRKKHLKLVHILQVWHAFHESFKFGTPFMPFAHEFIKVVVPPKVAKD
jgi:hypothetical protein